MDAREVRFTASLIACSALCAAAAVPPTDIMSARERKKEREVSRARERTLDR